MIDDTKMIAVNWVQGEEEAAGFTAQVQGAGGSVDSEPQPFEPPPDELDDYGDAQFEPLLVLATTVSLAFLMRTISNLWLEQKHPGGIIIDARHGTLVERPAPFLEHHTLVLLTDDGVQKFEPTQKNEALEALRAVIGHING